MKKIIFAAIFLCFAIQAFAQSNTKTEKIRELLVLTGSADLGKQAMAQMVDIYRDTYTGVDSKFWDTFMEEANMNELLDLIIPIYDEHYTEKDIDELIVFYKTPIGKKTIQKLPLISQQSMQAGQQWGLKLGQSVIEKLIKQGYDID